ncbi:arabinofuranosidase catalytic domain-containing protein [Massilia putida]|uniref:arabinofuranosidase catalytic domain-containing protein n=1 Tax=Massilia putida TaxID=1141883 RepID=UPI0009FA669B|nr:arabinofuranosidase catalytic domain-containing protein [Massilia putida]
MNILKLSVKLAITLALVLSGLPARASAQAARPEGPCDIYAKAGAPCVAAHSSTRALYAAYNGPLYQVMRQSDGKTLDVGVVQPARLPLPDAGGYANAKAQDAFCANTYCWITVLYDQSGKRNHLVQAPRGTWTGPALGGMDNLPLADLAPVTVMGHKVYGVYIAPGMGLRLNDTHGVPVDDQAGGQYAVINGYHYNQECCFDYGNGEIDSIDDDNGTMEAIYFGNATGWYRGSGPGPWVMADHENNLVGCVNDDKSKLCTGVPTLNTRFVTAVTKGKPGHWATLGGDAQRGQLAVMYEGRRIDASYDPMRKQGAVILGNGGDNSATSQGTFYEGAMTAPRTYPSNETDQLVARNVAAARYDVPAVSVGTAPVPDTPSGLYTFAPLQSRDMTVTFTNTTGQPVQGVTLSLAVPKGWRTGEAAKTFGDAIAPGQSLHATFTVKSGTAPFNGDLKGVATWPDPATHARRAESAAAKVRNVAPVKINEFRLSDGAGGNATNTFIELYNAGAAAVDVSNWTFAQHATREPVFSTVKIPAHTTLAPHGFYVLGLSNSGLVLPVKPGDATIHVRNIDGIKPGDTIVVGSGPDGETRKVVRVGTAAGQATPLWQPLPDGPIITIPAGSTSVPVTTTEGFAVGDTLALGYGTTYPVVGRSTEHYEKVTIAGVGTAGSQAWLGLDAAAGSTRIQVTSTDGIAAGDTIRLDIDSVDHGIDIGTVKNVGTAARRTSLARDAAAGATTIVVRGAIGFPTPKHVDYTPGTAVIGAPGNLETVEIVKVEGQPGTDLTLTIAPALGRRHVANEPFVEPGTGLELAAPLKYDHAANLPFSVRGTGIRFSPATRHAHSSNEPVRPAGSGIVLDRALTRAHDTDAAVRVGTVTTAGFQGKPDQWFGGPAISREAGSMVLRDAAGHVVDSLNYGGLVDPWASGGFRGAAGKAAICHADAPGIPSLHTGQRGLPGIPFSGVVAQVDATQGSTGRYPDGQDSDNDCTDFVTSASSRTGAAGAGATSIKAVTVGHVSSGQTVVLDAGDNAETLTVATVGSPGISRASASASKGATVVRVDDPRQFAVGQAVVIGSGAHEETGVVAAVDTTWRAGKLTLQAPLAHAHDAGSSVSGTGIAFTSPIAKAHPAGTLLTATGDLATPGAPNHYVRPAPGQ